MDTNRFIVGGAVGAAITGLAVAAVVAFGVTTIPGWIVIFYVAALTGAATVAGGRT